MMQRRRVDAQELRGALAAVAGWLDGDARQPARHELAQAVRLSLRALAQVAPGATVEVRVPPFAAVQCVAGPGHTRGHTRGTPPNVVETDPRTWLELATGRVTWVVAIADGRVAASGSRADVSGWLPLAEWGSSCCTGLQSEAESRIKNAQRKNAHTEKPGEPLG